MRLHNCNGDGSGIRMNSNQEYCTADWEMPSLRVLGKEALEHHTVAFSPVPDREIPDSLGAPSVRSGELPEYRCLFPNDYPIYRLGSSHRQIVPGPTNQVPIHLNAASEY